VKRAQFADSSVKNKRENEKVRPTVRGRSFILLKNFIFIPVAEPGRPSMARTGG